LIACRDLGVLGIRVNAIAPGTILTPPMSMVPDAMRDAFAGQVPFPKRLGRPEEYAQLAEHFVDNRYLNGMVARLDGGTRFGPR
jgi:NAD(P)-dependent dehydrogenase (short-subunit alcohol dehydrogenase family)